MRENYTLHKLHSLTGIIPTGFYLVQHLTLNSFALAGAEKFNGVIEFFEGMPKHFLYGLKALIWGCLIFHAVYGIFIAMRADGNYGEKSLRFRENRYFMLQRASGIFAFFFLAFHMASTSINAQFNGAEVIKYGTWAERLAWPNGTYLMLVFYFLGVVASAYHFSYGLWNFSIRWGITVSQRSQDAMAKVAGGAFVAISAIGTLALVGFLNPILEKKEGGVKEEITVEAPAQSHLARLSTENWEKS